MTPGIPGYSGEGNLLLPVLPLRDVCLFPEASLAVVATRPFALSALEVASRSGRCVLAVAQRDPTAATPNPRDVHTLGTVALLSEDLALGDGGRRVELDGLRRGRVVTLIGLDTLVAEVEALDEGDACRGMGTGGRGPGPLPPRPRRPPLVPRPATPVPRAHGLGQPGLPAPAHHGFGSPEAPRVGRPRAVLEDQPRPGCAICGRSRASSGHF